MKDLFEFINGPVSDSEILQLLNSEVNNNTGAQVLFIGRVRADEITHQNIVERIEYTSYENMAKEIGVNILQELKTKYHLQSIIIKHSLGDVKVGQVCVIIAVCSSHRKQAFDACAEAINLIKSRLPIWGKEITMNANTFWKKITH